MRSPTEFANHPSSFEQARVRGVARGVVRNIVDGDTYDVLLDLGLGVYHYLPIRLHNFDAAEIFHPRNAAEQAHGLAAKDACVALLRDRPVLVKTFRDTASVERWVADVSFFSLDNTTGLANSWCDLAAYLTKHGWAKRANY